MWGLFGKQSVGGEWRGPNRIHVDQPAAKDLFRRHMGHFLRRLYVPGNPLVILCIGTDRSTGDCLGPLVGSKLSGVLPEEAVVLGTLDRPVHAVNLAEAMESIRSLSAKTFVIALDACLGRTESVGYISLKEGPLQPGTGVNKNLPPVGDLHVIGIVNVGGFMEYLVLQNTRLSLVMHMAEVIAGGLREEVCAVLGQSVPPALAPSAAAAEAAVSQPVVCVE